MTEQIEERLLEFPVTIPGGMNAWDQADSLKLRSHQGGAGGFGQVAPAESPAMQNLDFFEEGFGTRLGSTVASDLRSILVASEELLDGFEWDDPQTGARIILALGKKALYSNQSGTFAQLTHNNTGATAFTFAEDVTKWSWCVADGHVLLFPDGVTNRAVAYLNGGAVEDRFGSSTNTTTVDADSNSGQKVLSVAATTGLYPGDRLGIGEGTAREEFGFIATVSAGVSVTLMDNLASTHTAVQADAVRVYNRYAEAWSTTTLHRITGDWSLGAFMSEQVTERVAFSDGRLIEYTPFSRASASGVWDLAGADGGAYFPRARMTAMQAFTPEGGDVNRQLLHVFTAHGPGILTGFEEYDQAMDANRKSGGVPLNHRCVVACKGWLVYLTENKDIEAINGPNWINLGRRLKNRSKTGPLDGIDVTQSRLTAFGFYDVENERVVFGATTASGRVNDIQFVVDLRQGEPLMGEARDSYEQKVRVHPWVIADPDNNDWFNGMFQVLGSVLGVTRDGRTWTVGGAGLPRADLDAIGIEDAWQTPWFNGGASMLEHYFLNLISRFKRVGGWSIDIEVLLNYSTEAAKTLSVLMTTDSAALWDVAQYDVDVYNAPGVVKKFHEISRFGQAISLRITRSTISQYWLLLQTNTIYQPGAMVTA